MAQEDLDAFRQAMEALNRGDVEAWVQNSHPDVVMEPLRGPIAGAYHGHDGLREGLLVDWKDYGDPKRALEAAGLSE